MVEQEWTREHSDGINGKLQKKINLSFTNNLFIYLSVSL